MHDVGEVAEEMGDVYEGAGVLMATGPFGILDLEMLGSDVGDRIGKGVADGIGRVVQSIISDRIQKRLLHFGFMKQ